jgi:hypothetical protein
MEHVCQHEGCQNGAALPEGDVEAAKAVAEVMECTVVDAPDGLQFFCKAHRNHALHRMRKLGLLDPPKPPEPPQLAPEATISDPQPITHKLVISAEVVVVCQKDRILGVFNTVENAKAIRQMVEALSPEPVYSQHWTLDTPGVQIMEEPEPPADDMAGEKGKPNAVQKGSKKKRSVQQR